MNRAATDSPARGGWRALATAAVLIAIALVGYRLRRHMISNFFQRTAPDLTARPALPPSSEPDIGAAPRVRVVVLDGLDRRLGKALPELSRLCGRGWDLEVDVGFPTVSLPVQTVLWTGLTQQQSGVRYVIARLDPPPPQALRSPGSIAITELHPYLVHSFAFEHPEPAGDDVMDRTKLGGDAKKAWLTEFEARAGKALSSDAGLVFVHIGRIDVAGHEHGRQSSEYREAAASSDRLLGRWADATDEDTRWFVLSDHGHRAGGGHAGAEDDIRLVRACVFGAGIEPMTPASPVHLVDLSHTLFSSAGQSPPKASAGRPVRAVASGSVELGSTLPEPPPATRLLLATLVLGIGVAVTAALARRRITAWPLWLPLAYLGVVLVHGVPTLSMPIVYPPLGRDIYLAGLAGLLVLAATVVWSPGSWARRAGAQLALPAALATAAWLCAGGASAETTPPLAIGYTAHASVLLVLTYAGALAAALTVLARAGLCAFGRDSGAESQRTGPSAG